MNRLITNVVELAYHECIDLVAHISAPIFNSIHIMIFCFLAGPPLEPSSIAPPLILLGSEIPFQCSLGQIFSPVNLVAFLFCLSAIDDQFASAFSLLAFSAADLCLLTRFVMALDYGFRNLQMSFRGYEVVGSNYWLARRVLSSYCSYKSARINGKFLKTNQEWRHMLVSVSIQDGESFKNLPSIWMLL